MDSIPLLLQSVLVKAHRLLQLLLNGFILALQVRLPTHPRIPPLHRQNLSSLLLIKSCLLLDNSVRGFKVRLLLCPRLKCAMDNRPILHLLLQKLYSVLLVNSYRLRLVLLYNVMIAIKVTLRPR